MATQSDLDKMRKKLSDLDAKLKSMRGNSAQRNPRFDSAMANQNYQNALAGLRAKMDAERGVPPVGLQEIDRRTDRITPIPEPKAPRQPRPSGPDFVDNRDPNKQYSADMVNYYDPATGEVTSRTNGIAPGPGSRFVRYDGPSPQGPGGAMSGYIPGYVPQRPQQGPQAGGFTQGRLMGAPTNQPAQSRVPMGFSTYEEAGIPPEQAKILDDEMAKMQSEIAAQQGRQNAEDIYNQFNEVASGINELMPAQPQQAPQLIQTIAGPRSAVQMNPQKMQAFQNFLQQGIQRSNTMNQDAATNFANMQAGAPTTEPATPSTAKPTMPVAGLGMQKSKAIPLPKTFSTRNTPSARFG